MRNPMHLLCGDLPVPYVPVRATLCAVGAQHSTYDRIGIQIHSSPRCRTSQYCRTCVPLSGSLWNDLADPAFDGER